MSKVGKWETGKVPDCRKIKMLNRNEKQIPPLTSLSEGI